MKSKPDDQPTLKFKDYSRLPQWAHLVAATGPRTEEVVHAYFAGSGTVDDVMARYDGDRENLMDLGAALQKWQDEQASQLIKTIIEATQRGTHLDIRSLVRWVILHPDDSDGVCDCMQVEPPPEVDIIRVLSRAGSQKLVFEATWRLTQRRVVVKRLTGTAEDIATILDREFQSHPLSMSHPNIIETHFLRNSKNETFLVERWLPEVLHDAWPCEGVQQAANLLYSLADAISFVHSQGRVHGDIKPDNIGKEDDRFILLDFGICRRASDFTRETTGTGSLRTRAPELLVADGYVSDATKVDVWAIGATLFNFLEGRFPLIDRHEDIPRISRPADRKTFENELARRVQEEWEKRVVTDRIPEPLRHMLEQSLTRDADKRPTAQELKELIEKELPVFLRRETAERFAPIDELDQLKKYLPSADVLALMPADQRARFTTRLARLREIPGFSQTALKDIDRLEQILNA